MQKGTPPGMRLTGIEIQNPENLTSSHENISRTDVSKTVQTVDKLSFISIHPIPWLLAASVKGSKCQCPADYHIIIKSGLILLDKLNK